MKTIKTIKIECETKDYIDYHDLKEFQGGLKERKAEDFQKAKKIYFTFRVEFPILYL